MKKILVVVDMQNDFITGPLGTPEAVSIVDNVVEKIRGEEWDTVYCTMDTHEKNYLETQEGRKLPVEHCVVFTDGWRCNRAIDNAFLDRSEHAIFIHKDTFGSDFLVGRIFQDMCHEFKDTEEANYELTLVGVCTDICVISNALLLKAHYPEMKIVVDASCCAGSTPEKHRMALEVMKSCQVDVVNDEEERNWIIVTNFAEKMAHPGYILSADELRMVIPIEESEG